MAIRPKLNRVWTSNNSVARRDPGDAKYLQGWVAEIPTYQVLNYLQYKIDTTMLAQAERGIFEWGDDVSYGVGSLAWDETNKTIYVCTVTNPSKTLRPSANLAQWSPSSIQVSRANYDAIVAAINAHIADVTTNPHRVTAAQIGAYNKAELDAIVANYRAMVLAHASDYNNPHNLTAVQVGAVPVTGGEYTGQVTMPTAYFNESKTAQLLQDSGLWLKNGNYLLGINGTTGFAETGTAASKSRIVTELNFPDVKAAQEPQYAHTDPSFQMNLINSINIVRGPGTIQNVNPKPPTYNQNLGGAFYWDGNASYGDRYISSNSVIGGLDYTIAIDYYHQPTAVVTDWQFTIGLMASRIIVTNTGSIAIETSLTGGGIAHYAKSVGLVPNSWNRIVATSNGTEYKLYLNGVLPKTEVGKPMNADRRALMNFNGGFNKITTLRGFRIWPEVLNAKQISTL